MSIKMTANLTEFENAANKLRELNSKYTEYYQDIFNSFRQIDSSWDGVDNDTFNEKFNSLEKDFIEMTAFVERTIIHLTLAGQSYDTVGKAGARRAERLNKYDMEDSKSNQPHKRDGGGFR